MAGHSRDLVLNGFELHDNLPKENLPHIILTTVKWLAGCVGGVLIYSSLFLYEKEEGVVTNTLERWWVKIDDLRSQSISRETAFLNILATLTSKAFSLLFGERLLGPKAIAASVCYSLASFFLFGDIANVLGDSKSLLRWGEWDATEKLFSGFAIFYFLLGSLGPFIKQRKLKWIWLVSVGVSAGITFSHIAVIKGETDPESTRMGLLLLVTLGVTSDCLFIVVTRRLLAVASRSFAFSKIIILLAGNAFLAVVLVIVPGFRGARFINPDALAFRLGLLGTAYSNVFDLLVVLSYFLFGLLMILHRLFWPFLERPLYALSRYRVFTEQKKIVFFGGLALIAIVLPQVAEAIEKVVKAVHMGSD